MEDKSLLLTLLYEVLGRPKKTNKHRGQYSFVCPVCAAEKGDNYDKAKFEVNVKRNVYKCWVCHETNGTSGSLKKLFWTFGNKNISQKIKRLGLDPKALSFKPSLIKSGTQSGFKITIKYRIIHSNNCVFSNYRTWITYI